MADIDHGSSGDAAARTNQLDGQGSSENLSKDTVEKTSETLELWRQSGATGNFSGPLTEVKFGSVEINSSDWQMALAQEPSKPGAKKSDQPLKESATSNSTERLTDNQKQAYAKELAQLFSSKGFTPEVKQKGLNIMDRVIMDGNPTGTGDPLKAKEFIEMIKKNLPEGTNLVFNAGKDSLDPDVRAKVDKYMEQHPEGELGVSGKFEIVKDGKVTSVWNIAKPILKPRVFKKLTDLEKDDAAKELAELFSGKGFTPAVSYKARQLFDQVLFEDKPNAPPHRDELRSFLDKIQKYLPEGTELIQTNKADPFDSKRLQDYLKTHPREEKGFEGKFQIKRGGKIEDPPLNYVVPAFRPKPVTV